MLLLSVAGMWLVVSRHCVYGTGRKVVILTGSASWKRQWVNIATEKQQPERYASCLRNSKAMGKRKFDIKEHAGKSAIAISFSLVGLIIIIIFGIRSCYVHKTHIQESLRLTNNLKEVDFIKVKFLDSNFNYVLDSSAIKNSDSINTILNSFHHLKRFDRRPFFSHKLELDFYYNSEKKLSSYVFIDNEDAIVFVRTANNADDYLHSNVLYSNDLKTILMSYFDTKLKTIYK